MLSGDAHTAFVCDLKRDFDDEQAAVIAAEFCGTSITSPGRAQTRTNAIVRDNRHILYGDSAHRGYLVLDVTAEQCTARLRVIDNPADRQSAVATASSTPAAQAPTPRNQAPAANPRTAPRSHPDHPAVPASMG